MKETRGVLTDAALAAMQKRNMVKAASAVAQMGSRYVGHPVRVLTRDSLRSVFAPPVDITRPGASLVRLGGQP